MLTLKNKKGFTLIELVIVMAIVGILAITAIVALSAKSADARNARRKSDMAAVLTAMALRCDDTSAVIDCAVDTVTTQLLTNCDDPGSYIDLTTVNDPDAGAVAVLCDAADDDGRADGGSCNYTITGLAAGTPSTYDPCDPTIMFALESGGAYTTGCAHNGGIVTAATIGTTCAGL